MCTQGGRVVAVCCILFYGAECVCSLSDSAFPCLPAKVTGQLSVRGGGGEGSCEDHFIVS